MVTRLAKSRLSPQRLAATATPIAVPALVRLASILAAQAARESLSSSFAAGDGSRRSPSGTIQDRQLGLPRRR